MKENGFEYRQQKWVEGRVSAVIPVYNGETYLKVMLDSLLGQTWPYMEIILVDDGSSDHTLQVAESYKDKFTTRGYGYRIIQAVHNNASAAINHGLPYVTGEYLIWPDSDDRLEKTSVEKRVKFLQRNPQYRCVRSLAYYYDSKTGELLPGEEKTGDLSQENLFWDILEGKTYVCCGCYMLCSAYFFEIYPERHIPEYSVGQNFQMLLPYMFRYQCATISERLYGVCVREGSHSRMKLSEWEEWKKYMEFEALVDEIASICHINDKRAKERITYWKVKRRYNYMLKYGYNRRAVKLLWKRNKYEKRHFYQVLKDSIWICLKDSWILKRKG